MLGILALKVEEMKASLGKPWSVLSESPEAPEAGEVCHDEGVTITV